MSSKITGRGDDFNFGLDMNKGLGEGVKKIGVGAAGLVATTGLAIGAGLIAIEATVGLAAAGGTIAAAFSALMAAAGPFLASAIAVIGALVAANPIAAAAIVGGVVVAAAAILIVHLAIKNSRTSQVMELLSIPHRTEAQNDKLAGHLRAWAEEGKVNNLTKLLQGKGGKKIDRELFFRGDAYGKSVMSILLKQQNMDLLFLLKDREFDEYSDIYMGVTSVWDIDFKTKEPTESTKTFFVRLAEHNFPLAQSVVKQSMLGLEAEENSFEDIFLKTNSYDAFKAELDAVAEHPNLSTFFGEEESSTL